MEEDDIVAVWSERVRSASAEGRAVRIRGGGTQGLVWPDAGR
ncbi:hypothetical protein OKW48_002374 [Paraburkholderia youngii]